VRLSVTHPTDFNSPETGIEILGVLHRLYPTQFQLAKVETLLCSQETLAALERGEDPRTIAAGWQRSIDAFKSASAAYRLYP
jgi:uncharacterized protein YbbC (DUF1343 family)